MGSQRRRVLLDGEAFLRHRRSGISRYFAELIGEYRGDPSYGVDAVTPYKYVANAHLGAAARGFVGLPMPGRFRKPVLDRLNAGRRRRTPPVDVVHHSLYVPELLDEWPGVPRVCTVYDFTFELFPGLFGDVSADVSDKNLFLDGCDTLLCISETTRRDLQRLHPELDKPVAVTPLGVAQEFFEPSRPRLRGLPERYFLHVGNRHAHKNTDLLLRAFARVAERDPTLGLVLCGAALPEEQARLVELGIERSTHVLRTSDRDLPALYRDAICFVFPSRYEGFGLPVLEAMASGTPVVVSDTPALVEVADDAALYFDPDDVDGLVGHMERLAGSPAERDRLIGAGRRRARSFSWDRTARATATAYDLTAPGIPRS